MQNEYAILNYVTYKDIKRVRAKLGLSQKEFAKLIGISTPTIERWEASKEEIKGPIVLLLNMIENNLEYINKIKIPKKEFPLRMFYMYDNMICTLIN